MIITSHAPLTRKEEAIILAFDPGVTTGVAVVDHAGTVVATAACAVEEVEEKARSVKARYPRARVVIERGPQIARNYGPALLEVERILAEVYPDATWVTPSQWKGTPASRGQVPARLSQHERDAVRLARWFQSRARRQDGYGSPEGSAARSH